MNSPSSVATMTDAVAERLGGNEEAAMVALANPSTMIFLMGDGDKNEWKRLREMLSTELTAQRYLERIIHNKKSIPCPFERRERAALFVALADGLRAEIAKTRGEISALESKMCNEAY